MTPEEVLAREAIRHTQSAYHAAGDRGRVADLVQCFTEDGVLELSTGIHQGRAAIAERLGSVGAGSSYTGAQPFLHHHLTTSHLEFLGDSEATGISYFLVMSPVGVDHCGRYADTYVLSGDRWLISRRSVRISWASPESIAGAQPSRP